MEWLNGVSAPRLIDTLEKLRKPLLDDAIVGPVVHGRDLNGLHTRVAIAEKSNAPEFLISVSKELVGLAAAINDLGLQGTIPLGRVKIEALPAMEMEEVDAMIAQGQAADLVHCICLLLAVRYLNNALAIKVQMENRQFGGH